MHIKQISSLQHPLVKHLVRVRQNRDYRDDHHLVAVTGLKLIQELVQDGFSIKTLIVENASLIPKNVKANEIFMTNEAILKKITGLQSSEGIAAEITKPASASLQGVKRLLVCDRINDPGNLGTLLRTALAFGWEGVYLINESCDPYNDKAIRAAKGATFRIPIREGSWQELCEFKSRENFEFFMADLHGTPVEEVRKLSLAKIALILGNEAQGVSEQAKNSCKPITIPMQGPMESLNVAMAGGILMYLLGAS